MGEEEVEWKERREESCCTLVLGMISGERLVE